jgi:hypothetical protein
MQEDLKKPNLGPPRTLSGVEETSRQHMPNDAKSLGQYKGHQHHYYCGYPKSGKKVKVCAINEID